MTKKNKTEVVIILDRSGSMSSISANMEEGFKMFVEQQLKQEGE